MLVIPHDKFAAAVEALMIAARSATDEQGLRAFAQLPRLADGVPLPERPGTSSSDVNAIRDFTDYQRINAITLGAIVALVSGPATVSKE